MSPGQWGDPEDPSEADRSPSFGGSPRRVLVIALAVLAVLVAGSWWVSTWQWPEPVVLDATPAQVADGGCVTSQTCRECRAGQHAG